MKTTMVRQLLIILAFSIGLFSCSKKNTAVSSGSWTFKTNTHAATSCHLYKGVQYFNANDSITGNINFTELSLHYYNILPTSGTKPFLITDYNHPTGDSTLVVVLTDYSTSLNVEYMSINTGDQRYAQFSMTNGKMNASCSNILMQNTSNPSDTGRLSFNITQQ